VGLGSVELGKGLHDSISKGVALGEEAAEHPDNHK